MQEALQDLGFTKNESLVIAFFANTKEADQRDIEIACGIRQSEVSVVMKSLKARGIITYHEVSDGRAARPKKIYSMIRHMVTHNLEKKIEAEYDARMNALDNVRRILNDNI